MRHLVTEVRIAQDNLLVRLSVKWRQAEKDLWVKVPWKWLATDDIFGRLQQERERRLRPSADPERPYLPLESWE